MGPEDFFEETETTSPWSSEPTITTKLRKDFLNELRAGSVAGTDDLGAAIALTHLVWDNLTAFGTDGGNKVIELAHSVKHSTGSTRREAGIAADSVIMLANILRRVDQDF
ncbi:hypothetical protein [Mycolicibacterium nivoides]|uniref:HNH endonuclease n=1 Tax=Mycolicibacterium nivoides TaxID=2487344 RepID=A0ABW9LAP3_9MYCO